MMSPTSIGFVFFLAFLHVSSGKLAISCLVISLTLQRWNKVLLCFIFLPQKWGDCNDLLVLEMHQSRDWNRPSFP